MQVKIVPALLLMSSCLLFSTIVCNPSHHHINHNDFPWQNILSSLGIIIENKNGVISSTEAYGDGTVNNKEHHTSESTVEVLKSAATDGIENPIIAQNGTTIDLTSGSNNGMSTGYKVGIPIVSIVFFILFWYCICKCCCACCQKETPGVVVMQSNNVQAHPPPAAPQIILQQPIIHQSAPPVYDQSQRWAQPPPQWNQPPQGPNQWNQPPQGPNQWNRPPQGQPQFAPHPMEPQQDYSPHSGYDNAGFNPATAPPPYNTKY